MDNFMLMQSAVTDPIVPNYPQDSYNKQSAPSHQHTNGNVNINSTVDNNNNNNNNISSRQRVLNNHTNIPANASLSLDPLDTSRDIKGGSNIQTNLQDIYFNPDDNNLDVMNHNNYNHDNGQWKSNQSSYQNQQQMQMQLQLQLQAHQQQQSEHQQQQHYNQQQQHISQSQQNQRIQSQQQHLQQPHSSQQQYHQQQLHQQQLHQQQQQQQQQQRLQAQQKLQQHHQPYHHQQQQQYLPQHPLHENRPMNDVQHNVVIDNRPLVVSNDVSKTPVPVDSTLNINNKIINPHSLHKQPDIPDSNLKKRKLSISISPGHSLSNVEITPSNDLELDLSSNNKNYRNDNYNHQYQQGRPQPQAQSQSQSQSQQQQQQQQQPHSQPQLSQTVQQQQNFQQPIQYAQPSQQSPQQLSQQPLQQQQQNKPPPHQQPPPRPHQSTNRSQLKQQQPTVFSSHSSQVTTPYDSLNPTPTQLNFNLNNNTQPTSVNTQNPYKHTNQNNSPFEKNNDISNNNNNNNNNHNDNNNNHNNNNNNSSYQNSKTSSNGYSTVNNAPMSEEVRRSLSNIAIVRFLRYSDLLTCKHEKPNLPYLKQLVADFFTEGSHISFSFKLSNEIKSYKISYCLIPLIYLKYLENVQMFEFTQKFLSANVLPDFSTIVETDHFSKKCVFEDGSYCNHFGSLKVFMDKSLKFEKFEIITDYNVTGIEFTSLEKFLNDFSYENKISPNSFQIKSHFRCISRLTRFGITEDLLRLLQVSDVMTLSKPLLNFYMNSNSNSFSESLELFNKINYPIYEKLKSNINSLVNINGNINNGRNLQSSKQQQQQQQQQQQIDQQRYQQYSPYPGKVPSSLPVHVQMISQDPQHMNETHGIDERYNVDPNMIRQGYPGKNNIISQVVTKTANKKFKLQTPPPKIIKKRKVNEKKS